jgi:predicted RNA binding protein with dsRBD fold (UPF0201 family)
MKVYTRVLPSEKPEIVLKILNKIFPTIEFKKENDEFRGEGSLEDLNKLIYLCDRQKILGTFRQIVKNYKAIPIHKEVAYWEVISFDENPPLGCIYVILSDEEKKELLKILDDKILMENLKIEVLKKIVDKLN